MVRRILKLSLLLALAAGTTATSRLTPLAAAAAAPLGSTPGTLAGLVTDARGVPQMGAAVILLADDGRTLLRLYTNSRGAFLAEHLTPGIYSLRVTLSSFLPVVKEDIPVRPGERSFLTISLASLLDAADSLISGRRSRDESDDDWKWVVRSSGATRPILRFEPVAGKPAVVAAAWRKTEYGQLEFTGGGSNSTALGSEPDFHTAFSVAESLFSNSTLLLSGDLGYERNTPATAFRGAFRRELPNGSTPEFSVTIRRVFLPGAYFGRGAGRDDSLQTLSLGFQDSAALGQALRLEYGVLYDSVSFQDRLNTLNPYGRAVWQATPNSSFQAFYTAGAPRLRLPGSDPLREVASQLAIYPRLSVRDGSPTVQRGRHAEAAFQHKFSPHSLFQAAVYRDDISNLTVSAALNGVDLDSSAFLPDVFTQNYSFNSGSYHTTGARVAYRQEFGGNLRATVAYSYSGMLAPERNVLFSGSTEELREILRMHRYHALAVKLGARAPVTGTRVVAAYKWVLGPVVTAGDIYDETFSQAEPNFNVVIRQPLPYLASLPGRVEALADFRNVLAQGYIPIVTADGKRLVLVQNVRSIRGGFSFNF